MQIKKINNNKLKVILSLNDLDEKNIDVDSFLSNSIESQNLFFEILDLAEEKYDFDIENNKAVVETVSLDNNIFVLTITKLKNDCFNNSQNPCKIYCFDNIDNLLIIFSYLKEKEVFLKNSYIYNFSNNYYLILNNSNIEIESVLSEYSVCINNNYIKDIIIEHGKIIK